MSDESRPTHNSSRERLPNRSARNSNSPSSASLIGLGTQMLSEVGAGVLLGLGADYMLETKGRWVTVGALTGVAVAMYSIFRMAMKLSPRKANVSDRGEVSGEVSAVGPDGSGTRRGGETHRSGETHRGGEAHRPASAPTSRATDEAAP